MMYIFIVLAVVQTKVQADSLTPTLVFEWDTVDLVWPNDSFREEYYSSEKYIPKNNGINGIKLYKGEIYLTIPKLKDGVPVSLVKVSNNDTDSPLLEPYPNWDLHMEGGCANFQLIQSMEIDPYTGYMWIIDTAFVPRRAVNVPNPCPKKLVIWDINNNREIHRYNFTSDVIGLGMSYLNDIVLDFDTNYTARWAYISDTLGSKLIVYDYKLGSSKSFFHDSMGPVRDYGNVTIGNTTTGVFPLGINGIALSSDLRYVYYCPVAGISLYRVSTSVLRNPLSTDADLRKTVVNVGDKVSQSDGLYYGQKHNLYVSSLGPRSVYKWPMNYNSGVVTPGKVSVVAHDTRIEWVDSFSIDDHGYLWFVTNNLNTIFSEDENNGTSNFFVWKVFVDDKSYMMFSVTDNVSSGDCISYNGLFMSFCLITFAWLSRV